MKITTLDTIDYTEIIKELQRHSLLLILSLFLLLLSVKVKMTLESDLTIS